MSGRPGTPGSKRGGVEDLLLNVMPTEGAEEIDTLKFGDRVFLYCEDPVSGLLSSEGWRRWVRLGDESMRRVAAAEGVPVLEVAEVLDGRSELFVDQYHFTPEGHRLFAARLADELEPRLRALEEAAR